MTKINQVVMSVLIGTFLLGSVGCSGMSSRDKSTAIGAGVGAVGGAVLTGGGVLGTVGGAAVGGIIGNQIGKDKK
jgi:osmotically inducible lipoprotein OsmB